MLRELEGVEPLAASVWHEVRADALLATGELEQSRFALAAASRHATGIRRATLLRRLAEAQLAAGQPDAALVTLQPIGRGVAATLVPNTPNSAPALAALKLSRPLCDSWLTLSPDAALAFAELTRAEALSHLIKREDALAAFAEVERRLQRITGAIAAELWVRWARVQTWFLCEILGKPREALLVCARVRQKVPPEVLRDEANTIGLLRAEEVACSTLGDFARCRVLIEEQISLARRQKNTREECLAWNARAILHFGEGELADARAGFERSRALAVVSQWTRREAIATHNLALVLAEQLELDEAEKLERRYQVLSLAIANQAAQAEAPLVLASIALARNELSAAESLIAQARKAAEAGSWVMLVAQARALSGRLHLLRFVAERETLELPKARNHLLATVDMLEERSVAWSEELDPGETFSLLALALVRSGQSDKARETLTRAAKAIPVQNVVSHRALALGLSAVEKVAITGPLAWFDERGYRRVVSLWRTLAG